MLKRGQIIYAGAVDDAKGYFVDGQARPAVRRKCASAWES